MRTWAAAMRTWPRSMRPWSGVLAHLGGPHGTTDGRKCPIEEVKGAFGERKVATAPGEEEEEEGKRAPERAKGVEERGVPGHGGREGSAGRRGRPLTLEFVKVSPPDMRT